MPKKKPNNETLVRKVFSSIVKGLEGEELEDRNGATAKDVLGAVAHWGGKSKDEIVQVLCREIGIATAAVLREPLNQILENKKLQLTIELVAKTKKHDEKPTKKKTTVRRPPKKKIPRKP